MVSFTLDLSFLDPITKFENLSPGILDYWLKFCPYSGQSQGKKLLFLLHILRSAKHFSVAVQSLSCIRLFATPWTVAQQAPLSFTTSQSLFKFMSIESVMPSNRLILFDPLLLLPSILPSIRFFSDELALHTTWPKYWSFSFSISPPMNIQGGFPLEMTGWAPCSPRDTQESSPTS